MARKKRLSTAYEPREAQWLLFLSYLQDKCVMAANMIIYARNVADESPPHYRFDYEASIIVKKKRSYGLRKSSQAKRGPSYYAISP